MQSSRCTSEKVEGTSLEFYFRGVNREVLVLSADGGLGSDTAAHFVDELKELIRGGATKLLEEEAPSTAPNSPTFRVSASAFWSGSTTPWQNKVAT